MLLVFKLLVSLLGLAVLYVIYKTIHIYMVRRKYRHLPGPATRGLIGFYMGNTDIILKHMKQGKILADLLIDLTQKHGPVFKFQIFDLMIVVVTSPDGVKEALITDNFPKTKKVYRAVGFPYSERFLGHGLITEIHQDKWKQKREMLNPGFHKSLLVTFVNEFNSKLDNLMERLRTLADGTTEVPLFHEINRALLDIIAAVGFGLHVDSVNDPNNQLNQSIYASLSGFYRYTFDPLLEYKPYEWGFLYRYKQTLRNVRSYARRYIIKQLIAIQESCYVPDDILGKLLKSYDKQRIDVEDMVDNFLTFFVAGQETTANALAFSVLELGRNPEVLKKMRAELDEQIGSKSFISYEDMTKLRYTDLVYKEVLRKWPPIPEISRVTPKRMLVDGVYDIPQNTCLLLSTYVNSRLPYNFANPEEFRPERFDLSNGEVIKNYCYFPFSLGARNCLGQNFARLVVKVFFAKFFANFEFKLLEQSGEKEIKYMQEGTLRPSDGCRCILMPRTN